MKLNRYLVLLLGIFIGLCIASFVLESLPISQSVAQEQCPSWKWIQQCLETSRSAEDAVWILEKEWRDSVWKSEDAEIIYYMMDIIDSIRDQTPWDRLALKQEILQKAREGR